MSVKAFVSPTAIEGLDEGILHLLAGRDAMPLDAGLFDPPQHVVAGQLGAIVGDSHCWLTAQESKLVELPHDPNPG